MVLVSGSNSKIGVLIRGNLCFLIFLRYFIELRAVKNRIFCPKRHIFLHGRATGIELQSIIRTMDHTGRFFDISGIFKLYLCNILSLELI